MKAGFATFLMTIFISGLLVSQSTYFPYHSEEPDQVFEMPKELVEISGLSISKDGTELYAIQDEDGKVYKIDAHTGVVKGHFEFWKDGDYEGIELVGNHIYVVKSSGTVYQISHPGQEGQAVEKFNFFLNKDNDVEGLCYDSVGNRLLLACKGKPGQDAEFEYKKAIYSFDLEAMSLSEKPVYLVSLEEVQDYLNTDPIIRKFEKVMEFFQPGDGGFTFGPSAIAIHPISGHFFITSAVGKLLLVMDRSGKILHIENLKKSIHEQPEGLCFDKEGNLYISNEGKDDPGKIMVFKMKKQ